VRVREAAAALAGGDGKDVGGRRAAADWPMRWTAGAPPPFGARVMVTEVWPRLSGEEREEFTNRKISRGPCCC
jgi:hypothetical protein